ncbi:MAG: nucleotidyl transferase AbiEii/AbiGii toxin family protein [Patescibacteria group bacterium]
MLSRSVIASLAQKYQTTEFTVWREYSQHLFLMYLYREPSAELLYFKGGTALRMLYQSPRFSEDLDFSSPLSNSNQIEESIIAAMTHIEREGIAIELQEAKNTTGGYLAIVQFNLSEETVAIQLEVSLRSVDVRGTFVTVASDVVPPYSIFQLEENMLIAGKFQATVTRKKPRDFYDIYFIVRNRLLPLDMRARIPEVLKALHTVPDILFDRELKEFLPRSHWPLLKDFRVTLERELSRV